VRQEAGGTYSAPERSGRALFVAKCGCCHATYLFTDESFRNNGPDRAFPRDSGWAHITARPADWGRFKVPSLRNVARTAPYMHDGRFQTLAEEFDHYSAYVQMNSLNLAAPAGINDPPFGTHMDLTATEKKQVIAFLKTLTDSTFVNDKRLSNPN